MKWNKAPSNEITIQIASAIPRILSTIDDLPRHPADEPRDRGVPA
jgi:hypothetical protein